MSNCMYLLTNFDFWVVIYACMKEYMKMRKCQFLVKKLKIVEVGPPDYTIIILNLSNFWSFFDI